MLAASAERTVMLSSYCAVFLMLFLVSARKRFSTSKRVSASKAFCRRCTPFAIELPKQLTVVSFSILVAAVATTPSSTSVAVNGAAEPTLTKGQKCADTLDTYGYLYDTRQRLSGDVVISKTKGSLR